MSYNMLKLLRYSFFFFLFFSLSKFQKWHQEHTHRHIIIVCISLRARVKFIAEGALWWWRWTMKKKIWKRNNMVIMHRIKQCSSCSRGPQQWEIIFCLDFIFIALNAYTLISKPSTTITTTTTVAANKAADPMFSSDYDARINKMK